MLVLRSSRRPSRLASRPSSAPLGLFYALTGYEAAIVLQAAFVRQEYLPDLQNLMIVPCAALLDWRILLLRHAAG